MDLEELCEHPRIDREVDRDEPRKDERRPRVVLPVDPELPVADADLRTHRQHVLREDQRRREGDDADCLRREERGAYRLWRSRGCGCIETPPTSSRRDDPPAPPHRPASERVPPL